MLKPISFGGRSTADKVLAGIDLSGKRIVVTGCNSGLGFETMNALASNGASVIGLARSLQRPIAHAPRQVLPAFRWPVILRIWAPSPRRPKRFARCNCRSTVVANAGIANSPVLRTRYGVEMQFLVNQSGTSRW